MASVITDSVTENIHTRITREGRKITYRLRVIQQPERARACGSGAKSSADRRPVDPPPIVELKLFEGEPDHEGNYHNDITWPFRANFFLFATLENARTIAHGRLPNPASFPVLTGTPVAGMSYLDRPEPAGYFIFPDLSVRHEGNYKLSFALYEELKEAKDMDPEGTQSIQVQANGIDAHVTHRLEVQSKQFQVYSAKKFPGLKESTNLSRTVAEQGCRVRIRRDVRMRRRDTKGGDKWDDYEDETAHERARHTATPDAAFQTPQPILEASRPGSASNASNASFAPPQRRTSMQDMAQNYQQGYSQSMAPPQPPQNGYQAPPQYSNAPPQPYQPQYSQPSHNQSMMQPPPAPYHGSTSQSYQAPSPQQPPQSQHSMSQMSPSYGYMQNPHYPQQGYEQPQQQHHHVRHESMEYANSPPDYRRPAPHQSQNHNYHGSNGMVPSYNGVDRQPQMNQAPVQQIPPLQHLNSSAHSTPHMNGRALAPLKTEKLEPASPSYHTPNGISSSPHDMHFGSHNRFTAPQAGSKRSYSSTFDTKHLDQPLRQGARPSIMSDEYHGGYDDGAGDMEVPDRQAMSYRRADGTSRSRRVPIAHD